MEDTKEIKVELNSKDIIKVDIVEEMKKSYIDYSMSVIVARALPDVRDGLKPSQRRILVAMNDLNLTPNSHYRKCAKIVGDTTGNYHPHGDVAAYETLVKMAQDFSTRYTLVDGQGNFGSIDGDSAAKQRYTEARLTRYALALLNDSDKGTVIYQPNYDATRMEPTVLAGLFPNLICNGCDGIAVGMATKIAPHNLGEIIDGIVAMIEKGNKWKGTSIYNKLRIDREQAELIPKVLNQQPLSYEENYANFKLNEGEALYPNFKSNITTEELMNYIQGPDFPTAGIIYNKKDILEVYNTGRGRIIMRAKANIEEMKNGKYAIIVTELPYQTNKSFLIERIAELVKDQKIKGISALRDESNREGIRIVIEIKKDGKPQTILNKLYKYTDMQKAFNSNMIALVDNEPRTLTLKDILENYLKHRMIVVIRRFEYELSLIRYKEHILQGLKIALDFLDEVIATIRGSQTQEIAKENLITKFKLTDVQAQAILDMQLRRLAALERKKIEEDLENTQKQIKEINITLSDENNILSVIKKELIEFKDKYGDKRLTKVVKSALGEIEEEDLVANTPTVITLSNQGYIKRIDPSSYKTQKRGGKGTVVAKTKDNDFVEQVIWCNTHDPILFFSNKGRVFELKAYDLPELSKQAKGTPIINFIQIDSDEKITAVLPRQSNNPNQTFLIFATVKGLIKKTKISDFDSIRSNGLIAISLNEDDSLLWVRTSSGADQIVIATENGKSIRFSEKDVKATGRNTKGVTGIRFSAPEDKVVSMDIINNESSKMLAVSINGYGKFTEIGSYPLQKRGGKGVLTFKVTPKTGKVSGVKLLKNPESELIVVSKNGILIRTDINKIPTLKRVTQGVKIMKLGDSDMVSSITLVEKDIQGETENSENN